MLSTFYVYKKYIKFLYKYIIKDGNNQVTNI